MTSAWLPDTGQGGVVHFTGVGRPTHQGFFNPGGPVTNTSESAICMLVHSQSYFRVSPPGRWKGALSPRLPLPLPAHTMPQESWELVRDGLSGSQRRC